MSDRLIAVIAKTRGPGRCRSCQAPITWYRTHPGDKAMPFNADPVALKTERVDGELIEHMSAADSHWASCPDAPVWKRR
jgi:hypothetical protein